MFLDEKLTKKNHLGPHSSVLGTIVGSQSVFKKNLSERLVIFLKKIKVVYNDENNFPDASKRFSYEKK